jgi:FG-GAP repeat
VVSPPAQQWVQGRDGVQDAPEAHDWFGRNLTTGDFDGDGYEDLAAGVFLEDLGAIQDAGGVEVLYGSAGGLQADGIGGPDDQLWTQDSPSVKDRSERGDYFGHTVASGDFNADGFDDLAVASRLEDAGTVRDSGSVEVLYGSQRGLLAAAHETTPDDQSWSLGSPHLQGEAEAGDQWGFSLATGDFDGDGHDDLAVGAPFRDVPNPGDGTIGDAGEVSVLFGAAGSGLQGIDPDDQMWTRDSPGVQDRPGVGDVFGFSLATGDSNADGLPDLAIGVLADDIALIHVTNAGSVAVLYAKAGVGLQAFDPDDQLWTQDALGIAEDGSENKDDFGWALA